MNLIDVVKKFPDKKSCEEYLIARRWPNGIVCLRCGVAGNDSFRRFTTNETTRKRFSKRKQRIVTVKVPSRNLIECKGCGYQFSATVGTIFHDSHLPLEKWFQAVALVLDAKKGMSALQVCRHLGYATPKGKKIPNEYKTIWFLCHRVREAMKEKGDLLTGQVEVDETYVGGRYDKRRKRGPYEKDVVMGLLQRKGRVEAYKIPTPSKQVLVGIIKDRVAPDATVYTDEWPAYKSLPYKHEIVNHRKLEYARGNAHVNSIENFWSLFKRGVMGSYHKVSIKHLERYLAEFTYRFNRRNEQPEMFEQTMKELLNGKALQYKQLTTSEISES